MFLIMGFSVERTPLLKERTIPLMKRLCALMLVLALCLPLLGLAQAEETAPAAALKYGDRGENVVAIQERLKELGYYTGKISGNFLEGTRAGIRRFQKDYELEVTGEADSETTALLMSAEYRVLRYGDDGSDVKRLQQHLKDLDYLSAKATGKFRDATVASVKAFQKHNDLSVTGEADLDTQRLLFSGDALRKGASPTATPDPAADLGDINDIVIAGDGEAVEEYAYERKLTRGAKGQEVKDVQTRLTELGFFDGPISGNYMNQTIAAVKAFQEHNGLRVDGLMGEETWNMLFNSADVLNTSATPRPTPVPTPIPYAVTVDVKNQVTIVYGRDDNGEYTIPVRRMVCSTGTRSTPSDVGEWVLSGRKARWCYFPSYGSHAQYWTKINDSIAFHSVVYNAVDYNAMSVKSYNMLGSRASHGCVRLLVSDAQWVYENIGEGVVVTITEKLPSDEELRKSVAAPPLNKAKNGPITTPEPTPEPEYISGAMPPQPFERLKKGSTGEAVYWLQMKLTELGYYTGTVTGGYYSGTEKAVKAFQKDHKISATGKADVRTLEAIYAEEIEANATPTPSPEPTFTPEPTATPAPTETPAAAEP